MREYELMVVISPQVADEGLAGVLNQVNQAVGANGGAVSASFTNPPWGHRRLAYPIRDFRDAYYAVLYLQFEPSRIGGLDRDLKLMEHVIRFLIVRRDDAIKAEAKAAARRPVAPQAPVEGVEGADDGDAGPE